MSKSASLRNLVLTFAWVALASTGCQLFNSQASIDETAIPSPDMGPAYQVRMYGAGKPQQFYGKIDSNKTITNALEECGALEKFARMEITLTRKASGEPLKLPIMFDSTSRTVEAATDYALHHGDIIAIRKDGSTAVTRAIEGASKNLGVLGRRK